jgi:hypothetical protein
MGHDLVGQYTTPPFKYCARARAAAGRQLEDSARGGTVFQTRMVWCRRQDPGRPRRRPLLGSRLPPSAPLSDADIDAETHIVEVMGGEPIQEACRSGAQIVIAGRSSETPIFAALPLLEGYAPGRRLAHGQDPRARRCSSCGPDRARLHDRGVARGQLRRVSAPNLFRCLPARYSAG